jgi:2-aminoadipate transaminase
VEAANSLPLDAASHVPLYIQLRDRLREMIETGGLRSGERLLPTRGLAQELGVNRATVEAAYAELESQGLVAGHVGRGTFVAGRPLPTPRRARVGTPADEPDNQTFPWSNFFPDETRGDDPLEALLRAAGDPGVISFAAAHPPADVVPVAEFRRACNRVLADKGTAALRPGPAGGYPPLQEWLSQRLGRQGIAARAEEITISNGCQQSLDLLAKAFVSPGQAVVIENPVYPGALLPFRQAGARVLALPQGVDGPDLAALEAILEGQRVRLVLVTPNFQNPTGATMTLESRQQLLRLAQRFQAPLVENDSYGWLGFAAKTQPPLKSLDHHGGVIYLGSFSKAGFPGLRLGWCVAPPEATARLRRAKQATDLHTDQFVQAVMVEFARNKALDHAVDSVRAVCRANAARLAQEVARQFPGEVVWRPPQGGMSAWFRLPEGVNADAVLARSREHRVVFTPGRYFYFQGQRPETFRLSFGSVRAADIAKGIKVLGEAIKAEIRAAATRQRKAPSRAGAGWSLV